MNTIWVGIFRFALNALVLAVKNVDPSQWAKIGELLVNFLLAVEDKLPAGNPLTVVLHGYRAAPSKLSSETPDGTS